MMAAPVRERSDAIPPADVVIARMRRRDLRQVLRIEERTSSTPWSLGLFLGEVRRAERCYLVARDLARDLGRDVDRDVARDVDRDVARDLDRDVARGSEPADGSGGTDGPVIGYAGMLFVLDEGHITTVAVDPEAQGRRVGTRLLLAMLGDSIGRGVRNVTLEVRASNDSAIALYRRFGFAPAGVRANYYADPVEDALVLWAHDVDTPDYLERLAGIARSLGLRIDVGTDALHADVLHSDGICVEGPVVDDLVDDPADDPADDRGYL